MAVFESTASGHEKIPVRGQLASAIGAFNAVAVICRYPDVSSAAIGMSGSYRIERFYDEACSRDLYFSAQLQFLPGLDGPPLDRLWQRYVLLASGEGCVGGHRGVMGDGVGVGCEVYPQPCGQLGPSVAHDWVTWRQMLPEYLNELA